ncbi:MAG: AmmeMemoRadiSam system protein B [Spirochaetes bacterium]|nr:MAG: AmmeMemoRadiSam system protein B [Spirochaetota bacterium]
MLRRSPVVAGSFYPSNPQRLAGDVEEYLNGAGKARLDGELVALIVPHAGYVYSGPVAAYSYALLEGSGVELVIVLAPSHRARFSGASVWPSGAFDTPLGSVPVDQELGSRLEKQPHISFIKEAHLNEHSLEVQLPFLQKTLPSFSLVPLIIGTVDLGLCRAIAAEIASVLENETRKFAVVISTDLSHYFPYERAKKIDGMFISRLTGFDLDALAQSLGVEESQACGEGPVLTGLALAKIMGARAVEILKYANSGDTAGGKDQVVGYLAAAVVK